LPAAPLLARAAISAFFFEAAKDKLRHARPLPRRGGRPGTRRPGSGPSRRQYKRRACRCRQRPMRLRYRVISALVPEGLDLLTAAQISGTSVVTIERHCGHLRGTRAKCRDTGSRGVM
jgi:hypothetical protein